jgi:hypothetical protein
VENSVDNLQIFGEGTNPPAPPALSQVTHSYKPVTEQMFDLYIMTPKCPTINQPLKLYIIKRFGT